MTIEHLVLAGGATSGILEYGALKYLSKQEFYNIANIKTIYGTSIGACIGAILCLKYDWKSLDDFIIKRPWNKLVNLSPGDFLEVIPKKGLLSSEFLVKAVTPLLEAKDLSEDITLNELYEFSNVELHLLTVRVNEFTIMDMSYKTHPDLSLLQAISMSSALPLLFQPIEYEDNYYVDGGVLNNYPVDYCLKNTGCKKEEVLGINFIKEKIVQGIDKDTNLFGYCFFITKQMLSHLNKLGKKDNVVRIPNEINIIDIEVNLDTCIQTLNDQKERRKMIARGKIYAKLFLEYKKNNSDDGVIAP